MACPDLHMIDVSDCHEVRSHVLLPSWTLEVSECVPSPDPNTVTLAEPVCAMLLARTALVLPALVEYPVVTLDTRMPVVTAVKRLPDPPPPVRQRTVESDPHAVASQDVRPEPTAEMPAGPIPAPEIVRLVDPVRAPFTIRIPHTPPMPRLQPELDVPHNRPEDTDSRLLDMLLPPI